MKTVVLDLDDFSVICNRMDLLTMLREHYEDFKISLFTIPHDFRAEQTLLRVERDKMLRHIKENLDWMQIIPHGLVHLPREFENCDKETMELSLQAIEGQFAIDGLPFVKGFKAPYWLWNKEVVEVLNKHKWFGAVDRNQPDMLKTHQYYVYDFSIDEPFWESDKEVLKLHGHMTKPSDNDLESCLLNLFKLPLDTKFKFVTDFLEYDKNTSVS